jgi:hypothetical protein
MSRLHISRRSARRAGERADKRAVLRIACRTSPLFLRWLPREVAAEYFARKVPRHIDRDFAYIVTETR